jgi:hypothetical protein
MYGEFTYGEESYADFDLTYALSQPDVLETLLSQPWKPRSWWLRARPRDASTSTNPVTLIDVNLSTDGHKTYPTDSEEIQLDEALITPYSLSFGLPSELWGQAQSTFGEIVIDNARGNRTSLVSEDWIGRDADVYLGPRGGTQVQFALVAELISRQIRYNRNTINIMVDDSSFIFDRVLQETNYAGTGSLEGGDEIAGKPKPLLLGKARQFTPVTVDGTNFIYQIHDGQMNSVSVVRDEGVALTFNSDVADITSSAPPAGQYNTSLANGYIRLGSSPNGKITCEAEGYVSSTYGYVDTIADLIKVLAVEFAGLDDPANLDTSSFIDLSSRTAVMGKFFSEAASIRDAMGFFHQSDASFGWLKPNKVLTVGRITDPDSASADFTADQSEINLSPWEITPFEIPVWRVRVGYRQYATTMTDSELDSTVPVSTRLDYADQYRFVESEDAATLQQIPDAAEATILTQLDTSADAQALADEQLSMRKARRWLATFSLRTGLISRGIGNVLQLTDDRQETSPKKWSIIQVENAAGATGQADRIVVRCYG